MDATFNPLSVERPPPRHVTERAGAPHLVPAARVWPAGLRRPERPAAGATSGLRVRTPRSAPRAVPRVLPQPACDRRQVCGCGKLLGAPQSAPSSEKISGSWRSAIFCLAFFFFHFLYFSNCKNKVCSLEIKVNAGMRFKGCGHYIKRGKLFNLPHADFSALTQVSV